MYCRFPKEFLFSVIEDSELGFDIIILDDSNVSVKKDEEENKYIVFENKSSLVKDADNSDDIWEEIDEEYSNEPI